MKPFSLSCLIAFFLSTPFSPLWGQKEKDLYGSIIMLDNCATKIYMSYVREIPSDSLVYAAIGGMFSALDGNSGLIINKRDRGQDHSSDESTPILPSHYQVRTLEDGSAYIWLQSIDEEGIENVKAHLKALGRDNIASVVLDLRDCSGGLLDACVSVADLFLPRRSEVVETRARIKGQNETIKARSKALVGENTSIAVLINNRTASGGELIAAALQHHDRAVLVGDTTVGIGRVGSLIPLDKKHVLRMTTAYFYSPSGKCLDAGGSKNEGIYSTASGRRISSTPGIIPDITVAPEEGAATVRVLKNLGCYGAYLTNPEIVSSGEEGIFEDFITFAISWAEDPVRSRFVSGLVSNSVLLEGIASRDPVFADELETRLAEVQRELFADRLRDSKPAIERELGIQLWRKSLSRVESVPVRPSPQDTCLLMALAVLESDTKMQSILRPE